VSGPGRPAPRGGSAGFLLPCHHFNFKHHSIKLLLQHVLLLHCWVHHVSGHVTRMAPAAGMTPAGMATAGVAASVLAIRCARTDDDNHKAKGSVQSHRFRSWMNAEGCQLNTVRRASATTAKETEISFQALSGYLFGAINRRAWWIEYERLHPACS
jgi:hypothetical protein